MAFSYYVLRVYLQHAEGDKKIRGCRGLLGRVIWAYEMRGKLFKIAQQQLNSNESL